MNKKDCFELGYIAKPHGIKGNFHCFFDVDDPGEYSHLASVFVEIGTNLVPYFIENLSIASNQTLIKFEGIDHIDDTRELVGKKLFLPIQLLPKLKDDQFYFHEIIDFDVEDKHLGKLGKIKEVISLGTQDLLVMLYQNREIMIPLLDEIVLKVDKKLSLITTDLPEGLLEVYLNDEN